jgi:phosphoribosylaminoimidazole-succinocarboxamide synthase
VAETVWEIDLPGFPPPRRGKVRDVFDLGDTLLIVASDRLSAYDHILRPGIPGKGKVLNQLSNFWFEHVADQVPHHLLATDPRDFPRELAPFAELLRGRAVLVRRTRVVPFECVARGYLAGSGYREYTAGGEVCGIPLPSGLQRASRLPHSIFTPATKAEAGHDENVSFESMERSVGDPLTTTLRDLTLKLYGVGADLAQQKGLILADTKFEFGHDPNGKLLLIDEVMTPDSSRFWDADQWTPGDEPSSFDKQYVRNWLDASGWDHEAAPPELPKEVVDGTVNRYVEAFRRITGREPDLD